MRNGLPKVPQKCQICPETQYTMLLLLSLFTLIGLSMAQTPMAPRTPTTDLGNQGMAASGGMSNGIFDNNTSGGALGNVMMLRAGGDTFRDLAGFRCLLELLSPERPMDPICFMLW